MRTHYDDGLDARSIPEIPAYKGEPDHGQVDRRASEERRRSRSRNIILMIVALGLIALAATFVIDRVF